MVYTHTFFEIASAKAIGQDRLLRGLIIVCLIYKVNMGHLQCGSFLISMFNLYV